MSEIINGHELVEVDDGGRMRCINCEKEYWRQPFRGIGGIPHCEYSGEEG